MKKKKKNGEMGEAGGKLKARSQLTFERNQIQKSKLKTRSQLTLEWKQSQENKPIIKAYKLNKLKKLKKLETIKNYGNCFKIKSVKLNNENQIYFILIISIAKKNLKNQYPKHFKKFSMTNLNPPSSPQNLSPQDLSDDNTVEEQNNQHAIITEVLEANKIKNTQTSQDQNGKILTNINLNTNIVEQDQDEEENVVMKEIKVETFATGIIVDKIKDKNLFEEPEYLYTKIKEAAGEVKNAFILRKKIAVIFNTNKDLDVF